MDEDLFVKIYSSMETFKDNMTLENFEILKKIGEGAFSTIYKASVIKNVNTILPDIVALKVMEIRLLEKLNVTSMASHEAKILSLLSHSFIVDYYACFSTIDHVYIVLEYIPNNLFEILRSKIYFGESTSRLFGSQILLGLEYLHQLKIAYRDLKPENILVGTNGGVKITDMSFAKYIPGRSYTSIGTVEYMAPEVILGEGHGIAVDWWGFGVLLYEMCAGHSPFNNSYTLNIMKNIVKAKYKFPLYFSDELKDLIKKLLVIDVTQRFGIIKGKSNNIKTHPWFEDDVDWGNLEIGNYKLSRELLDLNI